MCHCPKYKKRYLEETWSEKKSLRCPCHALSWISQQFKGVITRWYRRLCNQEVIFFRYMWEFMKRHISMSFNVMISLVTNCRNMVEYNGEQDFYTNKINFGVLAVFLYITLIANIVKLATSCTFNLKQPLHSHVDMHQSS